MKPRITLCALVAMLLVALSGGTANAVGDATCGINDSGGNTSPAYANGNASGHDSNGWFLQYGFNNCGTGTTVEWLLQKSTDGGASWQTVFTDHHTVTSSENGSGGPYWHVGVQSGFGCTASTLYRAKTNTYTSTDFDRIPTANYC